MKRVPTTTTLPRRKNLSSRREEMLADQNARALDLVSKQPPPQSSAPSVENNGGSTTVPRFIYGQGTSGLAAAIATSPSSHVRPLYQVLEAVPQGGRSRIQTSGDTKAYLEGGDAGTAPTGGQVAWLSATEGGKVTATMPETGARITVGIFRSSRIVDGQVELDLQFSSSIGGGI